MTVLIIEDEPLAAGRLKNVLLSIDSSINILEVLDTVKSSVKWLSENEAPDLIFMDIQLADGLSFEIFESTVIKVPVIFTTAYDEYALKAFKVNSIDYILKPIDEESLRQAFEKYRTLIPQTNTQEVLLNRIGSAMQMLTKKYKERFVTKVGEHLRFIDVVDVLYFFSTDKVTFCVTSDARKHILDFTLDQLEELVDPQKFCRINRKYIVSIEGITDVISHTNSRLKLVLKASEDNDVIVARERVQSFKAWIDR
ncbi:MAG: LytTR family DNA-binding domain-containing protein [Cyclobacteriaceae bacterium]